MPQTEVQQRATQAISGIATALTDLTAELHNAQQQLQYWRVEADAWKARYEQERARNNRLRRVLRCTPLNPASSSSSSLSMARSLTSTPKALRGSSSVACPAVSTAEADAAELAAMSAQQQQPQEEGLSGGGVTRRRSSTDAKSPLSPQTRQQHHQQPPGAWSNSNAGPGSSSLLSPAQQQQQSHTSFTQQRQQQLRPLKCVPEAESSSSGSGTDLAAQGKAAEAGRSATAATVAPAGSDSPSADPFANYDVGPVSDPGEHPFHQQPQQQMSSEAGCPPANLQQQQQLAGARTGARADADAAPAIPTFRRSRTLPVDGSLSTVHSPSFAAGFGPGSFLHQAASWLPPLGPGQGGDRGQGRHTVDQLLRMMMAFTLMQGAAGDADEQQSYSTDEDVLPSVSLDDDEGSSGVGLAAAAAVSAAMARAWATAASREQKAVAAAASAGGSGQQGARQGQAAGREAGGSSGGGRAGFRLVATVTNKMGKRQASTSALSSYASQDSISGLEGSTADLGAFAREAGREAQPAAAPSPKPPGLPISKHSSSSSLVRTASGSADAADGGSTAPAGSSSPSKQLSRFATASTAAAAAAGEGVAPAPAGSSPVRPPPGSSAANAAAAKSAAAPAAGAAPSSSQATTISLQWLSRPRTVLVMRKLAPSTEAAFLRALDWLRRHQVVIYVEPKVFQELVDAGRVIPLAPSQQQQQQQQQSQGPSSSSSAADAAATAGGSRSLPHSSSGSSLAGMLISTSPAPPQSGLFPVNSWAGPCTAGSNGSSGAKPAAAAAAGAGAGAVVGAGGAGAGVIKTWQPEVQLDPGQQGQQQQGDGSSGSGSGNGSMVQASDLIPDAVAQQLDLVVVLGGDGTVLWTCHIFGNRSVPPLVPFNLGSLGFLTPFDPARLEQVLLKTFRGSFPITLRHRLHCTIVRCSTSCPAPNDAAACDSGNASSGGLPSVSNSCVGHCVYGEEHVSLNEVVIERGISPFLTNLECFCDGTFVTHVQGDGLIVGTPTGSTAYSLAAGGSMVHPQVPCILFTPICPHSLSFRPLMFPDYVQLCVQVPADARGHVWASFDGKDRTELGPGDAVVIRLSKWPVPSVAAEADPSSDWFSAVRECLHWNMRKVQGGAGM